jgi:hypothetical protein
MVINADGLVLTNNHVIDDSTKITGTVASTGKAYPVVGYDKTGDVAADSPSWPWETPRAGAPSPSRRARSPS